MSQEEFVTAYDKYSEPIFRHCYFKTSNRELAKDLMQETFARTWRHTQKGSPIDNVQPFLYTVAKHLITDYYRKHKTLSLDKMQEDGFDPSSKEHLSTETIADSKLLHLLMEGLEEKYKEILKFRFIDDLGPKDIAELVGITENAVSVRINRGIKKLRALFFNGAGTKKEEKGYNLRNTMA